MVLKRQSHRSQEHTRDCAREEHGGLSLARCSTGHEEHYVPCRIAETASGFFPFQWVMYTSQKESTCPTLGEHTACHRGHHDKPKLAQILLCAR